MIVGVLEQRASKVLAALKRCGAGWHSRGELADQLGKPRLSEADVMALEYLTKEGFIEAEQHETGANIPFRWDYRIKEQ